MNKEEFVNLSIFATGEKVKIRVKKMFQKTKSAFQEIMVAELDDFGKCLIIDGVMQAAESDHEIYDREMLKLLKKSDRNLLVLGGGDGYVAEMAIKINPDLKLTVVDLDVEVVKICQESLGQKIFDDPRINLRIEDAFHYFNSSKKKNDNEFDGIIFDLTDAPIGRKEKDDFEKFYDDIIGLAVKRLRKNGWISIQSGASKTTKDCIDSAKIIKNIMGRYLKEIERSDIFIPSFGEKGAFLFGIK